MGRPKKIADPREMVKAAQLFYDSGLTKTAIAEKMFRSVQNVTWLLDQALEQGIVKFRIYQSASASLEAAVQHRYPHLDRVLIAIGSEINTPDKLADLYQKWAVLAADYFETFYAKHPRRKAIHVGISGGEHILEFVNAVQVTNRENLHIHLTALVGRGRLSDSTIHNDPIVNASSLWSRSGRVPGRCEYATVSPYVVSEPGDAARAAVKKEIAKVQANQTVMDVIKAMNSIDVAFVGIGSINVAGLSPIIRNRVAITGLLENVATTEQLMEEGAVGSLSYSLFDKFGRSPKKWDFFMAAGHKTKFAGVEFYKDMVIRKKIVVAFGGPYQTEAVRVALKAKMFNVWVTDEHTARQFADGD